MSSLLGAGCGAEVAAHRRVAERQRSQTVRQQSMTRNRLSTWLGGELRPAADRHRGLHLQRAGEIAHVVLTRQHLRAPGCRGTTSIFVRTTMRERSSTVLTRPLNAQHDETPRGRRLRLPRSIRRRAAGVGRERSENNDTPRQNRIHGRPAPFLSRTAPRELTAPCSRSARTLLITNNENKALDAINDGVEFRHIDVIKVLSDPDTTAQAHRSAPSTCAAVHLQRATARLITNNENKALDAINDGVRIPTH